MRRHLLFVSGLAVLMLLVLVFVAEAAEQSDLEPAFPMSDFNRSLDIAQWLLDYESAAWRSSDLVSGLPPELTSKLGHEWFCEPREGRWSCYYGKYSPGESKYEVVIAFAEDESGNFRQLETMNAGPKITALARAIHSSEEILPDSISQLDVRFNCYVRRLSDGSIEVWYLPAWQEDGTAVYGAELTYSFDPSGSRLISKNELVSELRGAKADPSTTLNLDNEASEFPTPGSIFFLILHHADFRLITIVNNGSVSALVTAEDGSSAWVHAVQPSRAD